MYVLFYKVKEYFLAEQERWFLWIPVLFGCGIGIYFLLPSEPSLWVSAVVVELLVLLAYYWRFSYPKLLGLAAVAMIVAGFVNIQLKAYYLNSQGKLTAPIVDYLSGEIVNIDHNYRGMERVVIKNPQNFDGKTYFGNYRISLRTKSSGLKVGDCAELVAKLMPLPAASMVGGYQFDRKFFFEELSSNGYAMASIGQIDCAVPTNSVPSWKAKIEELRKHIVARINSILPADEAGITAAIVAGERGGIRHEITENYRDSGLAHFLSISGLHMTMLAGLMFFLIRLIIAFIPPLALRYDSKKISAVAAILLSFFYLLISGAEIPTQRAFIMTLIVLVGVLIGRKAISMKTIAWAALIVLIISPWALIGASFQMSFAAVVMLIAFYEKFAGPIQRFLNGGTNRSIGIINRTVRIVWAYFAGIVISDLVASLATLPFGIYHFNMISIYTSLGNFLAGPVIGLVIMPFVLIALLMMPLGLDYWPLKLVGWGIKLVNEITAYVASLPEAGYQVLALPFWGLLLIVMGGLWLAIWQLPWRRWGWLAIGLGGLSILTVQVPQAMISADGMLFAVQDKSGNLVILPRRGKIFNKQMWLEKTANDKLDKAKTSKLSQIWKGKKTYPEWLDLQCNTKFCIYAQRYKYYKDGKLKVDGQSFNTMQSGGASFYADGSIRTVREYVGRRFWNFISD